MSDGCQAEFVLVPDAMATCRQFLTVSPMSMSIVQSGQVDLRSFVPHRFTLDRIEEAYELFANQRDNVIKVAITP